MKKFLALLLAVVMVLAMTACGTAKPAEAPAAEEAKTEAPAAEEAKTEAPAEEAKAEAPAAKRIFMSAAYYTAPYGSPLMAAIEKRCAELGYEIQIVDGEANGDKQLTQVKTAVADGVDGIIYWPGDSASTPSVVNYLNEAGIPWVNVNTLPDDSVLDKCTIVASDELQIGKELGKLVVKYYEESGKEQMNIAYIEGDSGSSYTIHLTQGIKEVIKDYPGIVIMNDPQYSNFDPTTAMTIMEDMITKYGDTIDLVLCQDGGMFQGAYNALAAANMLGTCGIICQGQDLIVKEKLLSDELYASVAQDPTQEGTLSVEVLDKLIKGESVDAWTYTPTGPIYKADVDNYSWF